MSKADSWAWTYEGRATIVESTCQTKRVVLANGAAFWVPECQLWHSSIKDIGEIGKLMVAILWHREQPEGYAGPRKTRATHG